MPLDKLLEGITQERNSFGMSFHYIHKGLHDLVGYPGRTASTAIVDKMKLRKIFFEKSLDRLDRALQEDKTADGWLQGFLYALLRFLVLILVTIGLVDEKGLLTGDVAPGIVLLQPPEQYLGCLMLKREITPRSGVFRGFISRIAIIIG